MAAITVRQKLKNKPETAFKKLKKYCDEKLVLREVGNLKPSVVWDDENLCGTFSEKGVKGKIRIVEDGKNSEIDVNIDVPLMMTPFKGIIRESVQKHLGRIS